MSTPATAYEAAAPSEEQLALAWRHLRGRGTCPDTLQAAQQHPIWRHALHGLAVNISRRSAHAGPGSAEQAAANLGPCRYVPPEPPAPLRNTIPRLHYGIDRKRAAANDRD